MTPAPADVWDDGVVPRAERFGDRATINQFRDRIWVRCPRGDHHAVVVGDTAWDLDLSPRRLTCTVCGMARDWDRRRLLVDPTGFRGPSPPPPALTAHGYVERGPGPGTWIDPETGRGVTIPSTFSTVEPWFGCALWLQTPCCGHTLWAYNEAHLDFLQRYVRATLRVSSSASTSASVLPDNLPAWIKAAKNRDAVLRQLERLRSRLAD
jgi:hypothetical protein